MLDAPNAYGWMNNVKNNNRENPGFICYHRRGHRVDEQRRSEVLSVGGRRSFPYVLIKRYRKLSHIFEDSEEASCGIKAVLVLQFELQDRYTRELG